MHSAPEPRGQAFTIQRITHDAALILHVGRKAKLIAKARKNGANYLYALLTGYTDPPAGEELREGMYYNTYFPGHQIAMAPPLFEEGVEYTDGSPMTIEQYAADVTAFLMWTAEPKLEDRKKLGFQVMLFLLVFAGLLYLSKKKLWANLEH